MGSEVNTTTHAGDLGHRRAGGCAEIRAGLDGGGVEVEHDHFMVGVADDVAAHGSAHVADTDEADLHCRIPLCTRSPIASMAYRVPRGQAHCTRPTDLLPNPIN
jgi:hypothetical protein